ncbi:hypothetical protein EVAR_34840_1 [Eumeta japonica]|uniref:Uncharacterized protein n=1 Tax=Eumeta variegata TaxID=151549 RepID=A0A4C1YZF8_EUMVA|nr:hypothetical protein EVAR_34840_1 [Eumeta japonica]
MLIEGGKVEQVKESVHLGNLFTNDDKSDKDIERRVNAGNEVNGAFLAIMNSKSVSQSVQLAIKKNENRINAVEILSLRSMCGVSLKDRCRNSDVRERCSLKKDVVTRIERGMLR